MSDGMSDKMGDMGLTARAGRLAGVAATVAVAMMVSTGGAAADRDFGTAVRHNMAVQTVDPAPVHDGALEPGGTGLRNVMATRRYMLDQLKPLQSLRLGDAPGSMGEANASDKTVTGQGK